MAMFARGLVAFSACASGVVLVPVAIKGKCRAAWACSWCFRLILFIVCKFKNGIRSHREHQQVGLLHDVYGVLASASVTGSVFPQPLLTPCTPRSLLSERLSTTCLTMCLFISPD